MEIPPVCQKKEPEKEGGGRLHLKVVQLSVEFGLVHSIFPLETREKEADPSIHPCNTSFTIPNPSNENQIKDCQKGGTRTCCYKEQICYSVTATDNSTASTATAACSDNQIQIEVQLKVWKESKGKGGETHKRSHLGPNE